MTEKIKLRKSEAPLDDVAHAVHSTISWLYNSNQADFNKVFGEDGGYLWIKFVGDKNGNEGDFFAYLDLPNRRKLLRAVSEDIQKDRF